MRYPGMISLKTASWERKASLRIMGSFWTGFGCVGVEMVGRAKECRRRRRPS